MSVSHRNMRSRPNLRSIPAVEKLVQALGDQGLPRPVVVWRVREELAALRRGGAIPDEAAILEGLKAALLRLRQQRLQPVINATGVLIHTNLGRAPLAPAAIGALAAAAGYCNLEFNLAEGERGGRGHYLEHNLAMLCGAEAATVVNNCAGALVLILRCFAQPPRDEVILSRGELVQIGGGFRIPEVLEASGARLREVGTTNRTTLPDYARAVGPKTALILRVHRSNFFMGGFVASPESSELAALARKKRLLFVEDLGSGAMVASEKLAAIEHEPTPAETLRSGAGLVCCSGDKLLGGPQAGLIAGRARWIAALKREPFFRALRCDKLVLAALQATVDLYLDSTAEESVPILVLLKASADSLRARAEQMASALQGLQAKVTVREGRSQIGGGALPRSSLPSITIALEPGRFSALELARRLRTGVPPIVGAVSGGAYRIDLRTVALAEDEIVLRRLREELKGAVGSGSACPS